MSEKAPAGRETIALTVSHEDVLASDDPRLWQEYENQRTAAIKNGQEVFKIRGIRGLKSIEDPAVVYDYYFGGEDWGYIEGNDLDGYDDYGVVLSRDEAGHLQKSVKHLNGEPIDNFYEAQKILSEYTKHAVLKYPPVVE